ncbi:Chemotaxis protein methyltransferase [subsurface metagenome]
MEAILTDEYFELFRTLIYDQSGIHFSETNRSILESRLKERLKIARLDTLQEYFGSIKHNQEEMKILLDSVTTNLTRFFRNAPHFETFVNFVIPKVIERKRRDDDRRLRLWSAGCSTGEEPYSVAMVMRDKAPPGFQIEVIGSDLSLKSLMVANEGFYAEARVADVPAAYLSRYFDRKRDGYQVRKEIKDLIKFDYHNLKNDSGPRNLDIVFCRNVFIYFDGAAQKAVIDRFWHAMSDYSYLFIGHSESLFGMKTEFEFVKTDWATLYRKNISR